MAAGKIDETSLLCSTRVHFIPPRCATGSRAGAGAREPEHSPESPRASRPMAVGFYQGSHGRSLKTRLQPPQNRKALQARDVISLSGGLTNPSANKKFEWERRQEVPTSYSG